MRVLIYKDNDSGNWIAQGVDFDIRAEAAGIQGAVSSFELAVEMQRQSDSEEGVQELSTCGRPDIWVKHTYEDSPPWEDNETIRIRQ